LLVPAGERRKLYKKEMPPQLGKVGKEKTTWLVLFFSYLSTPIIKTGVGVMKCRFVYALE